MKALSPYSRVGLTLLALPLLTFTPVHPAGAQSAPRDSTAEKLLACDSLPSAERLNCINAIVEGLRSSEPEAPAAPEPGASTKPPVSEDSSERPPDRPSERPRASEAVIGEVDAPKASEAKETYQRNSLARQYRGIPIPYEAVIVDVTTHYDGRFSVTLDNGDVWRETQGTRVRTPRKGAAVEVYEGSLGGIRMKIDGVPRAAWVRRID